MLPADEESFGGWYNEDFPFARGFNIELSQLNSKNGGVLEPSSRAACARRSEGAVWCSGKNKGGVLSS